MRNGACDTSKELLRRFTDLALGISSEITGLQHPVRILTQLHASFLTDPLPSRWSTSWPPKEKEIWFSLKPCLCQATLVLLCVSSCRSMARAKPRQLCSPLPLCP